jgi:hypothetical protein
VLERPESREVKRYFRTNGQNTQAMQVRWEMFQKIKEEKNG